MHHVVVPYPETNSSVRVRALHWIDRLVTSGRIETHDVQVHGPGFGSGGVPDGERVLLLRNAKRVSRGRTEERLLGRASLGVYDLDDGLPWDDGSLPGLGHWTKRPFPRALLARRAASAADRVVVGNDTLAAWAEQHCDDVRVIPTCIEPADYVVRASWEIEDGPPVIGWIGSPATEHYLGLVSDALAETHRRTGAVLRIISGPGSVPPALEPFATRSIWTPESTRDIAGWDLGIMPLSDGVYERAKCGYKLLQYAASGVPVVGSPVGVNEQLIADMDGLAPCAPDEWTDALIELINDPDTRRGERAQRGLAVAERFSYSVWEQRWIDAVGW